MRTTLLFLFMCLFISCEKEEMTPPTDDTRPCYVDNWGHLKITNKQSESYDLYINNIKQRRFAAGETFTISKVPAGFVKVEAKEVNFVLTQDVYTIEFTLPTCMTTPLEF